MQYQIRPWCLDDAKDLATSLNNKNILKNLSDGIPYPYTIEDAKEYITAMMNVDKNETFAFAITVNNRVIGSITAFRGTNAQKLSAEIGYYIAESFWGQGITTKALKDICKHIFETTNIIRIFANIFSQNDASARVLEKCKFTYEGTLRKCFLKGTETLDLKVYSLLRDEFVE